ncbi:MAG: ATP-binding protein [Nitrososphaera sp.]|uniref:ATP-binding protein n=1 Tax=Nitrososphaera sp. TaxID=1971748 RepID=UPI003D6F8DE2
MARAGLSRQFFVLVAIVASAAVLSVISYQYFTYVAGQIGKLAREEVRTSALVQGHALAGSLENKLDEAADNLEILATTPAVQSGNLRSAQPMMDAAQRSTSDLTDAYLWLDQDGRVLWSTIFGQNATLAANGVGLDLSARPYFANVLQTGQPYSHILLSNDGFTRMHFAYPIFEQAPDGSPIFRGVIAAAFKLETVGIALQGESEPDVADKITMVDAEGTIVYASAKEFVGMNYFTDEFQSQVFPSIIPLENKAAWLVAVTDAANSGSGTFDLVLYGEDVAMAYSPVFLNGEHIMTLFFRAPHDLAGQSAVLVEQQRTFATVIIVIICAIAAGISALVLSWNRALRAEVAERTQDLIAKTQQLEYKTTELEDSNKNLRVSNEKLSLAYRELEKHDRMQSEFANIAAHELRTPIQPILAMADMINDDLDGKDKVEVAGEAISIISRNARRLQKLSSEILDATRIESGTLRLEREMVDINEKVRNVVADSASIVPEDRDVRVQFKLGTDASGAVVPLVVYADRLRMFEVISNLIRNAIKFSCDEKDILVTTAKKDGQVVVEVKDRGSGISPEMTPRLFSKFSTDREKGGTGLGLFIAKNIVEAHGGRIWAENNKDGPGATFAFALPLAQP